MTTSKNKSKSAKRRGAETSFVILAQRAARQAQRAAEIENARYGLPLILWRPPAPPPRRGKRSKSA